MIELSGSIYLYMGYGTNIEGIWLQPLYITGIDGIIFILGE